MAELSERTIAHGFGLVGGVLIVIAGIVSLVFGAVDLFVGHAYAAVNAGAEAILLLFMGALALFFAVLANGSWSARPFAGGVLLITVALISAVVLALGGNVIALVGAILVFLGGVLYLIEPVRSGIRTVATA